MDTVTLSNEKIVSIFYANGNHVNQKLAQKTKVLVKILKINMLHTTAHCITNYSITINTSNKYVKTINASNTTTINTSNKYNK